MIANARYQLAKALRDKQTPEEILCAIENLIDAKTTPPAAQRQWVELTEKEVSRLWSDAHNDTSDRMAFQVFAAYIEAKLKEKNNG